MSRRALRAAASADARQERLGEHEWLEWLRARLDPAWRAGEWDSEALLFTGDLGSARTAAWPCRTPGCTTATRRPSGRCDGCRRARVSAGLPWAEFDSAPPPRATRPLRRGRCAVPGCEGDLHCAGLCFRHERCWGKDRSEPVAMFIARARPLPRAAECRVAGCDRESIARRGLCRFHDQRLHRRGLLTGDDLAAWVISERPRIGVHQFSLAGLPELLRIELLYALQQRDQSPPPLDPTEVRILLARLGDAASLREADPQVVCESGGTQYNSGTRGLFRDLIRHLDRAWAGYCGADPFAGDVWQVALLDLRINASRRWPADPGGGRLAGDRSCLAAGDRQGLGSLYPPVSAAAAGDAARLPGRLACPDHGRARRARPVSAPGTSPASSTRSARSGAPTAARTLPATAT